MSFIQWHSSMDTWHLLITPRHHPSSIPIITPSPQSVPPPPPPQSSPMASSSSDRDPSDGYRRPNRMVKIELDAARTLAGFAHLALLENEHRRHHVDPAESSTPCNGPRVEGDVQNRTFLFDLNQHASVLEEQGNDVVKREKKVQTPEDPPFFDIASMDCPSGSQLPLSGYGAKHNQTEAEKEAKRLRRVLANRESARQTIRRRQAFREELTKKADGLSKDNEIMKKEKERILREYLLLKDTNKQLKQKVAERTSNQVVAVKDIVSAGEMSRTQVDPSPSSTANNDLPATQQRLPFIQFAWPSNVPKTDCDLQSANLDCEEGGGISCFPRYPWFCHVSSSSSSSSTTTTPRSRASEVHEDSSPKHNLTTSHKGNMPLEKGLKTYSIKNKESDLNAAAAPTSHAISFLGSSSGGHQRLGNPTITTQLESYIQIEPKEQTGGLPSNKEMDLAVAADARKRRKKLTKWKRFYGFQQ